MGAMSWGYMGGRIWLGQRGWCYQKGAIERGLYGGVYGGLYRGVYRRGYGSQFLFSWQCLCLCIKHCHHHPSSSSLDQSSRAYARSYIHARMIDPLHSKKEGDALLFCSPSFLYRIKSNHLGHHSLSIVGGNGPELSASEWSLCLMENPDNSLFL